MWPTVVRSIGSCLSSQSAANRSCTVRGFPCDILQDCEEVRRLASIWLPIVLMGAFIYSLSP